jgi:hypothetical protein
MFGDFHIADLIAYRCSVMDNMCRNDLKLRHGLLGRITNERDYVSQLSSRIYDDLSRQFQCMVETINQGKEMEHGVDGLILFQFGQEIKIGWYEAKWPRVLQANYPWDRLQDDMSHFSRQVLKQRNMNSPIAIWEMFFNEANDGYKSPPYSYFGSSCVWHDNTFEFMKKEGILFEPWTTSKLMSLLDLNCINFYSIIYDIICCRKGIKQKIFKGQNTITLENPKDDAKIIEIPLPEPLTLRENRNERIVSFMEKENIAGYLFIDLEKKLL